MADKRVADYFNDNFVCTYLKVGAFQIINGQKVGGNVASYFCLADKSVLHAIPGQVPADKLLTEARWACDIRKSARTTATQVKTGKMDMKKYYESIQSDHLERYQAAHPGRWGNNQGLPATMPLTANKHAQAHWLLARYPLAKIEVIYPTVWRQILGEQLSALPIERR